MYHCLSLPLMQDIIYQLKLGRNLLVQILQNQLILAILLIFI